MNTATNDIPPAPAAPGARSLLSVFRLTSVGALLTVLLGVATNKLLAGSAGPSGVALVGLYRTLTAFVCNLLSLEVNTVVVQRISTAPSQTEVHGAVRAAFRFYALQCLVLLAAGALLPRLVSVWLFGEGRAAAHVTEVQVVLLLTTGVLGLRLVTALLSGEAHLKAYTGLNVFTSLLTVASVPPLLRLGGLGLSMVVGLSCMVGTVVGIGLVVQRYRLPLRATDPGGRRAGLSLRDLPVSLILTVRTALTGAAPVIVQSLIGRYYGTAELGVYNAASLIESTAMLVLMSSMRAYYLPQLGQMGTIEDKRALLNRMLRMLLVLILPGAVCMVFLARPLLGLLFSQAFTSGAVLCAVLGLSMVAQTYVWCFALFFLHRRADSLCLILEGSWAALFVAGTYLCARLHEPLSGVVWTYAASYGVLAILYVWVGGRLYRAEARGPLPRGARGLLTAENLLLGPGAALWILLAYALSQRGGPAVIGFMGVTLLLTLRLFRDWARSIPALR